MWKIGRRELAAAVVKVRRHNRVEEAELTSNREQRLDGGTTVSGTMAIAHMAGIKIFSTGGIGGVHRGAETSAPPRLALRCAWLTLARQASTFPPTSSL